MNDFNKINDIEWHDGILLETQVIFKETSFNMLLSVGICDDDNGGERRKIIIEFINIEDLALTMDTIELIDNHRAGNISNGYVKKIGNKKYKFFLYLSDGFLSLTFKMLRLEYM